MSSVPGAPPSARPASATPAIIILGADALLAARPATAAQLANACYAAGYSAVIPASWGDELVAAGSLKEIAARGQDSVVLCSCPRVADRMRRVGNLAPHLLPLVSPPVAAARYLRARAGATGVHITYVGECPAGADPAIDRHATPSALLRSLAKRNINPADQSQEIEERLVRDGRRFYSLPGGAPAPNWLYAEKRGYTLVEPTARDYIAEVAFRVGQKERRVVDLGPRLGCACSGAVVGEPWSEARERVAVLEPPRAVHEILDHDVPVELAAPIEPWTGSAADGDATLAIPLTELASLHDPEAKAAPVLAPLPPLQRRSGPAARAASESATLGATPSHADAAAHTPAPPSPIAQPPALAPMGGATGAGAAVADISPAMRPEAAVASVASPVELASPSNPATSATSATSAARPEPSAGAGMLQAQVGSQASPATIADETNAPSSTPRSVWSVESRTGPWLESPQPGAEPRTEPPTGPRIEPRTGPRIEPRTEPRTGQAGREGRTGASTVRRRSQLKRVMAACAVLAVAATGVVMLRVLDVAPNGASRSRPSTLGTSRQLDSSGLGSTPDSASLALPGSLPALPRLPIGPAAGSGLMPRTRGPNGRASDTTLGSPYPANPAPVFTPGAAPIPRSDGVAPDAVPRASAAAWIPTSPAALKASAAFSNALTPEAAAQMAAIRTQISGHRRRVDSLRHVVDSLGSATRK